MNDSNTPHCGHTGGLYHYGERYYDPITGRWTQQDPLNQAAEGNRYAYVGGDPINATDLGGLHPGGPAFYGRLDSCFYNSSVAQACPNKNFYAVTRGCVKGLGLGGFLYGVAQGLRASVGLPMAWRWSGAGTLVACGYAGGTEDPNGSW